jgi:hypothetical protein
MAPVLLVVDHYQDVGNKVGNAKVESVLIYVYVLHAQLTVDAIGKLVFANHDIHHYDLLIRFIKKL